MNRLLLVAVPNLSEDNRKRIYEASSRNGLEVCFCDTAAEAKEMQARAEIILGQQADLAENVPLLRWLCTPSAGVDQFAKCDVFLSGQAVLTNSTGAYGVTISEHIVMLLLEILRRQQEYTEIVAQRQWIRDLPVRSIRDSRITLVGTGDIGQETAIRLRGFSPSCLIGVNRSGRNPGELFDKIVCSENLEEVLPESDILILSLPGTPDTYGMLESKELALLPDGAVLINVGRGTVFGQKDLEKELRSGRLFAALDVFEEEPIPADDSLWTCPNLLITPHIAGNMTLPYTVRRIIDFFLEDLDNYCAGAPLKHCVDLKRGY